MTVFYADLNDGSVTRNVIDAPTAYRSHIDRFFRVFLERVFIYLIMFCHLSFYHVKMPWAQGAWVQEVCDFSWI